MKIIEGIWKRYIRNTNVYAENDFVVGWKGQGLFDAGMVYAPYLPIEDSDSEYSESLVA